MSVSWPTPAMSASDTPRAGRPGHAPSERRSVPEPSESGGSTHPGVDVTEERTLVELDLPEPFDHDVRRVGESTAGFDLPVFLAEDWDEEVPQAVPELLAVEGGDPIFYLGKSHCVAGPSGHGKTWLVLQTIAEHVAATPVNVAVFIDCEDVRGTFRSRMRALGLTKEQASRVAHWSPPGDFRSTTRWGREWLTWVDERRPTLVCIDSVAAACALGGLDDEKNAAYNEWDRAVIKSLDDRGITSIRIDHTGHTGDRKRPTRVRGASSKTDRVTGCSYLVWAATPWDRKTSGRAELIVWKDRCGARARGQVAADVLVTVSNGGSAVRIALRAPTPETKGLGDARPTAMMEKASRHLEALAEPISQNGLCAGIHAKKERVVSAVKLLCEEGFVERTAKGLCSVRPYRASTDPVRGSATQSE